MGKIGTKRQKLDKHPIFHLHQGMHLHQGFSFTSGDAKLGGVLRENDTNTRILYLAKLSKKYKDT